MSEFRGHTLDKVQAAALDKVIEYMKYLHDLDEEGEDMQDTVDSFIQETEAFLYELGAIKKTVFSFEGVRSDEGREN